jgi:hypothetical protein
MSSLPNITPSPAGVVWHGEHLFVIVVVYTVVNVGGGELLEHASTRGAKRNPTKRMHKRSITSRRAASFRGRNAVHRPTAARDAVAHARHNLIELIDELGHRLGRANDVNVLMIRGHQPATSWVEPWLGKLGFYDLKQRRKRVTLEDAFAIKCLQGADEADRRSPKRVIAGHLGRVLVIGHSALPYTLLADHNDIRALDEVDACACVIDRHENIWGTVLFSGGRRVNRLHVEGTVQPSLSQNDNVKRYKPLWTSDAIKKETVIDEGFEPTTLHYVDRVAKAAEDFLGTDAEDPVLADTAAVEYSCEGW